MIQSVASVFVLEVRQILAGKKFLATALLLAGAAGLAFVVRRFAPDAATGWPAVYLFMMTFLYLHTFVLLVPMLFMTSLIREETDEGTLVYLVTRPVAKPWIILAKFAAAAFLCSALIAGGMILFHAAFTLPGKAGTDSFDWGGRLFAFIRAGVLGAVGYGAVFTLAGLFLRRALVFGIAYGFLSEFALSLVPAVVRKVTLMHYLRSQALYGAGTLGDPDLDRALAIFELSTPLGSAAVILVVSAVLLALSCLIVSTREFLESRGAETV